MTATMILPTSVGAEVRDGSDQEDRQVRLHKARLGLQLHFQPVRRKFGLGARVCSMCDQRWGTGKDSGRQGCPARREALADFFQHAQPADLRWAIEGGVVSETEATSAHRGRASAAPSSPDVTWSQYPIDTEAMRLCASSPV